MIKLDAYIQFCMLAVAPRLQNQGVGKAILAEAERRSAAKWAMSRCVMEVIGCRQELIAFYERRGYRLTGEKRGFPSFEPKALSLQLVMMEKTLTL
jgi:ribosomal protein S18 acetylase RimI-like enzyme